MSLLTEHKGSLQVMHDIRDDTINGSGAAKGESKSKMEQFVRRQSTNAV